LKTRFIAIGLLLAALVGPTAAPAQSRSSSLADQVAEAVRDYAHFTIFDEVTVADVDGMITIGGHVTKPFKRTAIAARVVKVAGVREVVNEIEVLPVSGADAGLRRVIAAAIYGHPTFWPYAAMARPPIHIVVAHGHVRLTGLVTSEVERRLAYALAQVEGASSISNELRVDR
jgi:osmotically-inducible protein OsmY